ncbi:MAG: alpha/beta hydrolase [Rhodospirillaceae bacterium]|jgi:pimeloyl-ACP methyl ester carboxylesterase|nr:alpha/beta hydrolase [Rhodospirillaceae bacterium]MBT4589025.1 alpha/beta hydrolase [Rhodospirillaceae bacterium]MBT4939670.1 alpha/beta hydrolase [Rhodospirillaceae bacterium]MBT5941466.1 alpha/beta hydrolase [Rhodospirillaceae bacterium]MBT7268442.1 alpha/beta hydrolase [Rhodospirillaceae bacterium]
MTNFVLVHGAWHGGWCWRKIEGALRAAGHQVFAPTLTGLGERAHLASPDVVLSTHIQDVVGLIETEELSDVILVGHSYAGTVITGVAGRIPDRLKGLVYLDAFVPESGQSMQSMAISGRFEQMQQNAIEAGDPIMIPPPSADFWSVIEADDVAWLNRRVTPHPINTYTEAVEYSGELKDVGPLTYIHAAGNKLGQFDRFAEMAEQSPDWHLETVPCGHEVMVDMPDELVEMLLAAAER